jgi:hypothetical protein
LLLLFASHLPCCRRHSTCFHVAVAPSGCLMLIASASGYRLIPAVCRAPIVASVVVWPPLPLQYQQWRIPSFFPPSNPASQSCRSLPSRYGSHRRNRR